MPPYDPVPPRRPVLLIVGRALFSTVMIGLIVCSVALAVRAQFDPLAFLRFAARRWLLWLLVFGALLVWDFWAEHTRPPRR